MSPWKLITVFWVPASVLITALAGASVMEQMAGAPMAWMPLFDRALDLYRQTTTTTLAPLDSLVEQQMGFAVPAWANDSIVGYLSSAAGFASAGANFTSREDTLHAARSSAASMTWPIALLMFAGNALRHRVVSRFAREHTLLFVLYALAVIGVVVFGLYGEQWLGQSA